MRFFFSFLNWFKKSSLFIKIGIIACIGIFGLFFISKFFFQKSRISQYQTAKVVRDTLVVSVTGSGQVASVNSALITTQASGVLTKVYVKDGDIVKTGDKIAEIDLDLEGKQRNTQAYANYENAKTILESTKANLYSLQSTLFTSWKTYMDIAQSSLYQNSDGSPKTNERQLPQFMSTNDDWLAAEAKYKNQQNIVNQAQTALTSSWFSYQQASPVIYAPISGTVNGFSLQIGSVITAQSNSSGGASSQKIASIKTDANPTITINVSEIDVPKIKVGDKATVTLSALTGKTYTGKVISVDTVGIINSGVVTYPTVIQLDIKNPEILPNMSASASIITQTKDNVLLAPSSALQFQNGESIMRRLYQGKVEQITVETGLSSETQVEIISGLSEGDIVVTGMISNSLPSGQRPNGQSPFSTFGIGGFRGGGFGGGGGGNRNAR